MRFVHLIAGALTVFLDHQSVLEAGTAAALDEDPEPAARFVLFGKQLVDFCRGRFGYVDHLGFLLTNRTVIIPLSFHALRRAGAGHSRGPRPGGGRAMGRPAESAARASAGSSAPARTARPGYR